MIQEFVKWGNTKDGEFRCDLHWSVNYDYMFHCSKEDLIVDEDKDGDENLSNPVSDVETDIYELVYKGNNYTTQIGGSAFITLKVVKSILPELKVAYVGACGTPNDVDLKYGKSNDIEWLFTTKERLEAPYDNNTLLNRIKEQEGSTGRSFAEYLADTKWIHLSSLSDFEQFEAIMFYVIKAKKMMPH